MKTFKKIKTTISTLLASAIVASSASAIYASATAPSAYVDITYSNGVYTANVIFENMPYLKIIDFKIELGSGWDYATQNNEVVFTKGEVFNNLGNGVVAPNGENLFTTIAAASDREANGTVLSFPVTKTSSYSANNAKINIKFTTLIGDEGVYTEQAEPPVMLKANEFIIGDANGDGTVDASDSSTILAGIENHPIYKVYNIRKTYHNYFIGAKAAAAPDANQNGYINQTDADLVLDYYVDKMVGRPYSGPIGKIDVYEVFE